MKKIALLSSAAIFGAALFSASPASALSVTVNQGTGLYNSGTKARLDLPGGSSPDEYYGYYLGSFNLTIDGAPNITAFCLDLLDSLSFGHTYNYVETATPFDDFAIAAGAQTQIKKFFDFNFGGLSGGTDFAAFQLGLWELVYDGPIAGVATNNFTTGYLTATGVTGVGTIIDTASKFLNNIFGSDPAGNYDLTFIDSLSNAGDRQDLVYATENQTVIPLPAAIWLLGGSLISFAGLGRLKKRRKAVA